MCEMEDGAWTIFQNEAKKNKTEKKNGKKNNYKLWDIYKGSFRSV